MRSSFSESALRALGVFGLTSEDVRDEASARGALAARRALAVERSVGPGQIALITGPSASGKTSILRALEGMVAAGECVVAGAEGAHGERVIDALSSGTGNVAGALRSLSAAGLADAFVPARLVGALSAGERARLGIARTVLRAERVIKDGGSPTIVLDDFADGLDDATAIAVSRALRRWIGRNRRARVVIATVRACVREAVGAAVVVDLGGSPTLRGGSGLGEGETRRGASGYPGRDPEVVISVGTMADYRALAHLHYRAGRPATVVRVLVAREGSAGAAIGVLVVSMPTLNGAWRGVAWPGEYGMGEGALRCKRAIARAVNRDIRCISRLIVDPLHRGRGVASALVRGYLERPLTRRTECPSAMGGVSPVFVRAGMREWMLEPARRDVALGDALRAADLAPWMLADVELVMERIACLPHMERALRVWANAHGPTRELAEGPVRELVRAAARQVVVGRRAYTAG